MPGRQSPQPRYKIGDQVEIVRDLGWPFGVGAIATVDLVRAFTTNVRYRLVLDGRQEWANESDLGFRQLELPFGNLLTGGDAK